MSKLYVVSRGGAWIITDIHGHAVSLNELTKEDAMLYAASGDLADVCIKLLAAHKAAMRVVAEANAQAAMLAELERVGMDLRSLVPEARAALQRAGRLPR